MRGSVSKTSPCRNDDGEADILDDVDVENECDEGELKIGWEARDNAIEPTESEILEEEIESERQQKKEKEESKKRIKRENKTINYVDSDRMLVLIKEYYDTDKMSDELALDIRKICDRLMTSSRFCNYTYRDEMAADAFVKAYEAIHYKKFSLDKGYSPFSYLTQIAFHAAQARIKKEKKERLKYTMYVDENYDKLKMENSGVEMEDDEWN